MHTRTRAHTHTHMTMLRTARGIMGARRRISNTSVGRCSKKEKLNPKTLNPNAPRRWP